MYLPIESYQAVGVRDFVGCAQMLDCYPSRKDRSV